MMKPQIDSGELMQRIRREARRHENLSFPSPASPVSVNADHGLALPPVPVLAATEPGGFPCESLLAQIGNMLDRARGKTTVRKGIPLWLRRFYRNQGGYNDIVLEAMERLREANRLLMTENVHLRLHVQRQTEWMQAVRQRFAQIEDRLDDRENREERDPASPIP